MSTLPACCTRTRRSSYSFGDSLISRSPTLDDTANQVDGEVADPEDRPLALRLQLVTQCRAYPGQKFVHPERLGDIIVGAAIERLDFAGLVAAAGQDHDGNGLVAGANGPQQLVALHIRQAEIENDQIRRLAEQLERGLAIGRFDNLIALRGQSHAQELADRRLVVDHQHAKRCGGHAATSSRCRSRGIGRLIVNTAPVRSVRFAATMVPCMASTKPREIASPSPVPARTWSAFCAR